MKLSLQQLAREKKEAEGGFSSASCGRNIRALKHFGFVQRMETLSVQQQLPGETPLVFDWSKSKEDAPSQRRKYMKHIRENFPVPETFVWIDANGEVLSNGNADASVPTLELRVAGVYDLTGTTDVLLVPATQVEVPLDNAEMVLELKKTVNGKGTSEQAQTIVELLAHGLVAQDKRLVALLSDLRGFYRFYWFEISGAIKYVKFSQILTSPSAAHAIIKGLLGNDEPDVLAKRCAMPVRSVLTSIPEMFPNDDAKDDGSPSGNDHAHGGGGTGSAHGSGGGGGKQNEKKLGSGGNAGDGGNTNSLADFGDLPGSNLLSLIDGSDPQTDLAVAREYVHSFFARLMPGVAAQ
jgi:hypothetical protein